MEAKLTEFERAIRDEGIKRYLIKLLLLAGLYLLTAQIGLSLSFNFEQITTIWPPTGIAITAILLWGYHYWPGIFIGAFIANAISGAATPVATGIALGNTLEAIVAVLLIERFIGERKMLEKISSTMAFVILVCFLSTMISATIGVTSLWLSKTIATPQIGIAWLTWWMGDMMAALVIVPLVVAWKSKHYREQLANHVYEAVAMLLLVVVVSLIIFGQPAQAIDKAFPLVYLIFPLIMVAAVRFTQIGAATAGSVITIAALWGTLSGTGPYTNQGSVEQNIFVLHFFILVIMVTALVLSVAVYGRLQSERELAKQARELQEAKQLVLRNIEWRKDMQVQMEVATDKINDILEGIFEKNRSKKPPYQ